MTEISAHPVGHDRALSAQASGLPRLADGTRYFGQLAELAYDPDEDRVQCHLCGEWFRLLGSSHLRRTHGWTLAEYRETFHLPAKVATCSRDLSLLYSTYATSQIRRGSGFGEGVGVPVALRPPVRVPRWRSLAARADLAAELHPARNPDVDLSAIAARSGRKLWWRCEQCGHEWEATVGARSAGSGCPECARERLRGPRPVAGERSLQALHPGLLADWHPIRNSGLDPARVSPGSKLKVWWRCAVCRHEWQATVHNRTRVHGSGCPVCGLKRRARTQSEVDAARSLAVKHPELAAELHPQRNPGIEPTRLAARSGLKLWWQCGSCGHEWEAAVSNRTEGGTGCPVCGLKRRARTQSEVDAARSLAVKHPELAAELHPQRNPGIEPTRLAARSGLKLWWQCGSCGHEWEAAVSNRTGGGTGCPVCGLKRRARTQSEVDPARSLAVKHPELAAELHPQRNPGIEPTRLGARSSLKLWWQCRSCGHEWKTAVSTRTDGSGCPACYRANRRGA